MELDTVPPDVLRRAELFDFIANLVHEWPHAHRPALTGPVKSALPRLTGPGGAEVVLPYVGIVDQRIACNTASVDLQRRPLMLRLFQAFCEAEGRQLSRDEILKKVYLIGDLELRSERYLEAKYGNAVKLISRARILAAAFLGRAVRHGIEWFVYDQERRTWCLFRMRNEYFTDLAADH